MRFVGKRWPWGGEREPQKAPSNRGGQFSVVDNRFFRLRFARSSFGAVISPEYLRAGILVKMGEIRVVGGISFHLFASASTTSVGHIPRGGIGQLLPSLSAQRPPRPPHGLKRRWALMSHTRKVRERGKSSVFRQFPKLFPRGIILFSLRDNLVSAVWENNDCQMVKVRPSLHYARVFSVVGVTADGKERETEKRGGGWVN